VNLEERFPSALFGAKVTSRSATRSKAYKGRNGMTASWLRGSAWAAILMAALATSAAFAQTAPAAPDPAQPADDAAAKPKPKPAPKPKAAKPKVTKLPSIAVVVTNSRSVGLTELDGALSGGADSVKILGALAAGKKVVIHLAHDKPCLFDLHGVFDDLTTTDVSSVNLCTEKKINLVE